MKRKLAILLSIILAGMSLAGCSQVERGYLNMSKQISTSSEYQATGSLSGEIDFDALATLADKTINQFMDEDSFVLETSVKDDFSEAGLIGTKKVKVNYNLIVDMKSQTAFWADFDLIFNGKAYEMGDLYFDMTNGIYVSKDLLIGIYDLCRDIAPNEWDPYFYSVEYRNELLNALGDSEYIYAGYLEEQDAEITAEIDSMAFYSEKSYEAAYQFIETAFSGFTTGTVSQTGSGYQISLNGKQGKKLIVDMLQYFADNTGKIMDAYKDYFTVVMDHLSGVSEEEKAEAAGEFEDLLGQKNQIMISSYFAMAKQMVVEADKARYLDFLDGFKYEENLKKSGNKYISSEDTSLKDGAKTVFSISNQCEIKIDQEAATLPEAPEASVSFDELQNTVDSIENKYNPVNTATIEWWNDDYDYQEVSITYERAKASPLSSDQDYDLLPYFIESSHLYVPMRSISEKLGENVVWNKNEKRAYVVQSGKQIPMSGVMKDGVTYIKIADFEKLGYKVSYEYEKEWGLNTVTLSK